MKVEIKNVKTCEFASEETLCFEAKLYIDGQSRIIVSNQGHGGSNNYGPSKRSISTKDFHKDMKKLDDYCKTLPKIEWTLNGEKLELDSDLDTLVSTLLERYEITKELKKDLKRRICLVKDNKFYTVPNTTKKPPTERMIEVAKTTPALEGYTILNALSFDEAYSLYKSALYS